MWVWSGLVALDPAREKHLLDFASTHQIDTVYVQANRLIRKAPKELAAFIDAAAKRNIGVELLFGDHDWALPQHHADALKVAKDTARYVASLTGAKPTGVHYDVEPHALDQWTDETREAMASDLLDLLDLLDAAYGPEEIRVSYDMPNWYSGLLVTRAGKARPMSELVIDRVDVTVVMDYRDNVDDAISLVTDEVAYATQQGKVVVVGLETSCNTDSPLTFCEEGSTAFEQALNKISLTFAPERGFGGLAIHHFESFDALVTAPNSR